MDNYLSNKLAQDYKGQAGQVAPEQYKRALQEIAATGTGRRKERSSQYYYDGFNEESDLNRKNDAVDAKIVEDVLKEFLCWKIVKLLIKCGHFGIIIDKNI